MKENDKTALKSSTSVTITFEFEGLHHVVEAGMCNVMYTNRGGGCKAISDFGVFSHFKLGFCLFEIWILQRTCENEL